jgi:hypothetical protein
MFRRLIAPDHEDDKQRTMRIVACERSHSRLSAAYVFITVQQGIYEEEQDGNRHYDMIMYYIRHELSKLHRCCRTS